MPSIECGHRSADILVGEGPVLPVTVGNRSATIPIDIQLEALLDTGSEWSLIQNSLAIGTLHLMHIDDRLIQTANGSAMAPVYMGQLTIAGLTYSKLHRFVGVDLGTDRAILGRELLRDFTLTYSGPSGKVSLEY